MRVVVVRRALVVGMLVIVRVGTGVKIVGTVPMLAFLAAVPVRRGMRVRVAVTVRVGVRMRVMQVAMPVPVFVRMGVLVAVLVQVIVCVNRGAGGFVVRHGATPKRNRQEEKLNPTRPIKTSRSRPASFSAAAARARARGRGRASAGD